MALVAEGRLGGGDVGSLENHTQSLALDPALYPQGSGSPALEGSDRGEAAQTWLWRLGSGAGAALGATGSFTVHLTSTC